METKGIEIQIKRIPHHMKRPIERKSHKYCWFCYLMLRLRVPVRCLNCIGARERILRGAMEGWIED